MLYLGKITNAQVAINVIRKVRMMIIQKTAHRARNLEKISKRRFFILQYKVKEPFIHFNAQTGTVEHLKAGDTCIPTKKDFERFPLMFEKVQPTKTFATKTISKVEVAQ